MTAYNSRQQADKWWRELEVQFPYWLSFKLPYHLTALRTQITEQRYDAMLDWVNTNLGIINGRWCTSLGTHNGTVTFHFVDAADATQFVLAQVGIDD